MTDRPTDDHMARGSVWADVPAPTAGHPLERVPDALLGRPDRPTDDDPPTMAEILRDVLAEREHLWAVIAAQDAELAECHAEILRLTR